MNHFRLSGFLTAALAIALLAVAAPAQETQPTTQPSAHDIPKMMPILASPEGQALIPDKIGSDYEMILNNWVPQLRSHCGAATAVVVQNALQPDQHHTQDGLFTDETAHIITQDVVYRIGFTIAELVEMINVSSGLQTEGFHAGSGEGQHGYEEFLAVLRENRENPENALLINYSTESVRGLGTGAGHWSPVAEYNEEADMVLMCEVNSNRSTFWISSRDLYDAMDTVDKVCDLHRGWIVAIR